MTYNFIIQPEALGDLDEILEWYNRGSAKTGTRFLNEFYRHSDLLCQTPRMCRKSFFQFRKWPLKIFPYYIVYTIDDVGKRILVFAVWHKKRGYFELKERLRSG